MSRESRKRKKECAEKRQLARKASLISYAEPEGVAYVEARIGDKARTFHRLNHADTKHMLLASTEWLVQQGAREVGLEERPLAGRRLHQETIIRYKTLGDSIRGLARAAEDRGAAQWEDLGEADLAGIAAVAGVHVAYIARLFDKARRAFSLLSYCELARDRGRPEASAADPAGRTRGNSGVNRLMRALFGSTRA